jgi:hypothetical protein
MRKIISCLFLFLFLILASSTALCAGQFEPYVIKPGVSYYSDEYTAQNDISELGEEKNFEEVYQFYNYYEAVFDTEERIVTFKAYKRGALEFSETYFYDDAGNPEKKIVRSADGTETVMHFQD